MCSVDERHQHLIEHSARTLVGQRVIARALGYADLNDHEQLRHDPAMGALLGKLSARVRRVCAALAGKSTLSRLALYPTSGARHYHKIRPGVAAIERLLVALFLRMCSDFWMAVRTARGRAQTPRRVDSSASKADRHCHEAASAVSRSLRTALDFLRLLRVDANR